jgi:hypothetical protein
LIVTDDDLRRAGESDKAWRERLRQQAWFRKYEYQASQREGDSQLSFVTPFLYEVLLEAYHRGNTPPHFMPVEITHQAGCSCNTGQPCDCDADIRDIPRQIRGPQMTRDEWVKQQEAMDEAEQKPWLKKPEPKEA